MVEASNFAEDHPQVPLRLVERIPGRVRWDPDLVPLNRRMRKRLQRAKSIVIHLFSGTNTEIWDSHDQEGLVFLNIEIKRGTDMHKRSLVWFLGASSVSQVEFVEFSRGHLAAQSRFFASNKRRAVRSL